MSRQNEMVAWLKRWLILPVFEEEEKNRVARLAHRSTWAMLLVMVAMPFIVGIVAPAGVPVAIGIAVPFVAASLLVLYFVHGGRLAAAGWLFITMFYLMITWSVVSYRGVRDLMITGYFIATILAMLFLSRRDGVIVSLATGATIAAIYMAEANGLITPTLEASTPPIQAVILLVIFGFVTALMRFAAQSNEYAFGELHRTAAALREANLELESSQEMMRDHTAALERRSAYLQASSEVAHAVVSMLDVDQLLLRVVDLIRDRFGLYYVGIFLLDETEEWVHLRAGTGSEGQKMLARGHRIRLGEGMIGWSVAQGEARVAQEASADRVRLVMPELPATQAEAALPLRSRGRVLGAITIQDTQPGIFDQEAVTVLQLLADQVAVALDNARLLAESQSALEAERRAYGEVSAQGWAEMGRRRGDVGYLCRQGGDMAPVHGAWPAVMAHASERGEVVVHDGDASRQVVAVPLKIRDRVTGVIRLAKTGGGQAWTTEELALVQTLTSQLEVALESARLYDESQRRAARERLLGDVGARIRETLDMDTVLRTALQEIGRSLDLAEVEVRMSTERGVRPGGDRAGAGSNGDPGEGGPGPGSASRGSEGGAA